MILSYLLVEICDVFSKDQNQVRTSCQVHEINQTDMKNDEETLGQNILFSRKITEFGKSHTFKNL